MSFTVVWLWPPNALSELLKQPGHGLQSFIGGICGRLDSLLQKSQVDQAVSAYLLNNVASIERWAGDAVAAPTSVAGCSATWLLMSGGSCMARCM